VKRCSPRIRPLETHSRAQGECVPLVLAARLPRPSYVRVASGSADFVSRIKAISQRHRGTFSKTRPSARTKKFNALATEAYICIRVPAKLPADASTAARLCECVSPRREVAIRRGRIVSELASADGETPIPAAAPSERGGKRISCVLACASRHPGVACRAGERHLRGQRERRFTSNIRTDDTVGDQERGLVEGCS